MYEEDEDEDEENKIGPHPDATTTLIFTNRQNNGVLYFHCIVCMSLSSFFYFLCISEFTAGEVVQTVIGFTNDAESEFIVTGIEASFR